MNQDERIEKQKEEEEERKFIEEIKKKTQETDINEIADLFIENTIRSIYRRRLLQGGYLYSSVSDMDYDLLVKNIIALKLSNLQKIISKSKEEA